MTQTNELNKQYERALAFYANMNNYNCEIDFDYEEEAVQFVNASPIYGDRGKLARKALKEGENKKHDGLGKQYVRTLMFYANAGLYKIYNYETDIDYEEELARFANDGDVFDDRGKRARSALTES